MNALAIDCAVAKISVAAKKDAQLAKAVLDVGMRQSEKLLPAVGHVLGELGLAPGALDYAAVTLGPGSFTGLRLGLSTLKALTLACGTPVYGVSSLEAYAWPYRHAPELALALIASKGDEYFYGLYRGGERIEEGGQPAEGILAGLPQQGQGILACGPGAAGFAEWLRGTAPGRPLYAVTPAQDAAESLFSIAERMMAEGVPPLADYDGPRYLRKSEAEIVREQQSGK